MDMRKYSLGCILSLLLFSPATSSPTSQREFNTFLHPIKYQCPFLIPSDFYPVQVDGEAFDKAMSTSQENGYMSILFHNSQCPFSRRFQSKFSTLSSMYPQIKHLMVEQSSALPSIFSRYGIHSLPTLLIVNKKTQTRYYGRKELQSLVKFYRRTTGLDPVANVVEDTSKNIESGPNVRQLSYGQLLKEVFLREPYVVFSAVFVCSRAFMQLYPDIASRLIAICVACIPHLNLGILGESKQLIERMLHLVDVKRIWNKLQLCKARSFHSGALNARVLASSLASVSLGETS